MGLDTLTHLQALINDISKIKRNHFVPQTDSREDVMLHSSSVALLAWQLFEEIQPLGLDLQKVILYALIHDFTEVYAGDTNSFADTNARRKKQYREANALKKLREEFSETFPSLVSHLDAYEAKVDEESVFVWSVDKIQAKVQGHLDIWRTYYNQGISKEQYTEYLKKVRPDIHPALRLKFDEYCAIWIDQYDDGVVDKNGTTRVFNRPSR